MIGRHRATVLIVEDDPGIRTILVRSLEQEDYVVLQADEGGEALELIDRHGRPELLISDLTMPGMGGAELGRLLRQRWPELPILFLSGYSTSEMQRQGATGPNVTVVEKPFSPAALVARVAAILRPPG